MCLSESLQKLKNEMRRPTCSRCLNLTSEHEGVFFFLVSDSPPREKRGYKSDQTSLRCDVCQVQTGGCRNNCNHPALFWGSKVSSAYL